MFPAWSPDGTKVAFAHISREPDAPYGSRYLAVYDLSSATSIPLLELPEKDNQILGAAWHPNGRNLYVISATKDNDKVVVHEIDYRARKATILARFNDESISVQDNMVTRTFLIGDRYLFLNLTHQDCYRIDLKRKRIHKAITDAQIYQVEDGLFFTRENDSQEPKRIQLGRLNPKTLKTKVLCELPCTEEDVLAVIDSTPVCFPASEDYNKIKAIHLYDMRGRLLKEIALESRQGDIAYQPLVPVPPYETLWMLGAEELKDSANPQWWLTEVSLQSGQTQSRSAPLDMSLFGDPEATLMDSLPSSSPKGDKMFLSVYYEDAPSKHLLLDLTRFGQEGWIQDVPPPGDGLNAEAGESGAGRP